MAKSETAAGTIEYPVDVEFFVKGVPQPQPRPRFSRKAMRVWSGESPAVVAWKGAVSLTGLQKTRGAWGPAAAGGSWAIWLAFVLPRPKTVKRQHHTVKPDIDNLTKAVMDALSRADIWRDDAQVTRIVATKRYARSHERVGCHIGLAATATDNGRKA